MDRDNILSLLESLDIALQPIICLRSGALFAAEALLRNTDTCGYPSIGSFFDALHASGMLFFADSRLRRKALVKFRPLYDRTKCMLFYNYDPRIQTMPDYRFGTTETMLEEEGITCDVICFELSEKHPFEPAGAMKHLLTATKERGFKIALDDFGVGFSSMEVFYHCEPHFLKFDRFLISGIDRDIKKRSFCSQLLNLARMLGVTSVAEGIETEGEFAVCRDIGFDCAQGFFIQRPVLNIDLIKDSYHDIFQFTRNDKRKKPVSMERVLREMTILETIRSDDDIKTLFSKFNLNSEYSFFPAIDSCGRPLGIIHERSIKGYIYTPFGYDLLCNKGISHSLSRFIRDNPIADIGTPLEGMLELFVNNPGSEGIILTDEMKYAGYLTSRSLLNLLHEKNMEYARELNPLTKLPGNLIISRHITQMLVTAKSRCYFIYFDLDHFKPFNDRFGFRQGDRAILLFAETLCKFFHGQGVFVGHIGGDDFFVSVNAMDTAGETVISSIHAAIEYFNGSVNPFYDAQERAQGRYIVQSREGAITSIPLLTASAAMIELRTGHDFSAAEEISQVMADQKKIAKSTPQKISYRVFPPSIREKTAV